MNEGIDALLTARWQATITAGDGHIESG